MLKALRTPATLLNSQFLASRPASSSLAFRVRVRAARSYATETSLPSSSSADLVPSARKGKKGEVPEGPLRPHLGVEVNPNHGLWAFFRKKVGKDGVNSYEALEAKDNVVDYSGVIQFIAQMFGLMLWILYARTELQPACFIPSFQYRSCMERRRASTKEFQGPSHPLVRRPEREESA